MGTKRDVPEWAMNFRIFCIKKGLKTSEVASKIGMSSASVSRYFKGDKRPKTVTCKNIQNAIGFDMLKEIYLSDRKEIEGWEDETNTSEI
jgi:transcriptional regulator with XRE-family HTH domain